MQNVGQDKALPFLPTTKHAHGEPFGKLRRALSNHHPEPVEGQRVAYAGLLSIQIFESDLAWR